MKRYSLLVLIFLTSCCLIFGETFLLEASAAPAPFPRRTRRIPCPSVEGSWSGRKATSAAGDELASFTVGSCNLATKTCKIDLTGTYKQDYTYTLSGTLTFDNVNSKSGSFSMSGIKQFIANGAKVEYDLEGSWTIDGGNLKVESTTVLAEAVFNFTRLRNISCEATNVSAAVGTGASTVVSTAEASSSVMSCSCEEEISDDTSEVTGSHDSTTVKPVRSGENGTLSGETSPPLF